MNGRWNLDQSHWFLSMVVSNSAVLADSLVVDSGNTVRDIYGISHTKLKDLTTELV